MPKVKEFIPRAVFQFIRKTLLKETGKQFNGIIYSQFSEVSDDLISKGYASDKWVKNALLKCRLNAKNHFQIDYIAKIVILVNLLSYRSKISILDFGGGVGQTFFAVKKYFTSKNSIIWNIVDVEDIIQVAQKENVCEEALTFQRDINNIDKVDLVFINQTINLIGNYKEWLQNTIERFHPMILFLCGVPSGENKEYVTLLLLDGKRGVPTYIMNEKELLHFVNEQGYFLLDSFVQNGRINLDNFDAYYQLDRNKDNFLKGYVFTRNQ